MKKALFIIFAVIACSSADLLAQRTSTTLPLTSAHRGASRSAPENTKAAFVKAIEAGANFIEIDVRTTSDGVQVIVHDKSLRRTTGLDALVSETSYATIKKLSAGSWFGKEFKGETVPTLEEVCVLVNAENKRRSQKVALYVDSKAIDAADVVSILKKYDLINSAVFYGDVQTLKNVKQHFPSARLMPAFPGIEQANELLDTITPYAFDVSFEDLNEKTIAYIHGKQIKVFSDLLGEHDNPASYRKAVDYGIDLIQTDDVQAVRKAITEFEAHHK
jgi:glycerophosphoryl diester phosphodiesterase